jgi:hypothetical protein
MPDLRLDDPPDQLDDLVCLSCSFRGQRDQFMEHDPRWWSDAGESVQCPCCGADVSLTPPAVEPS